MAAKAATAPTDLRALVLPDELVQVRHQLDLLHGERIRQAEAYRQAFSRARRLEADARTLPAGQAQEWLSSAAAS